jgi:hypothetical protein
MNIINIRSKFQEEWCAFVELRRIVPTEDLKKNSKTVGGLN